jgi:hypothetical protein
MAKATKRVAVRKKSSKRGKASAKPARKTVAKHSSLKKAKSKVQPTGMNANKPAARKKRPTKTVETLPAAEMPVETMTIDVIEESAPGVVAVAQYESVQAMTPIAAGDEPKGDEGIAPAGTSTMAPDPSERPEHEAKEQRDALTG